MHPVSHRHASRSPASVRKGVAISRITLFSLLLALLLGVGIRRWYIQSGDLCARFLAGDRALPAQQYVPQGSRTIVVPCTEWLPRMPARVQVLCLLGFTLAVVFVLHALGDLRTWFESWRRLRQ